VLTGVQGKRIHKLPTETSIYLQGSGSDLYERIAKATGFSAHRLRITKGDDGKPVPNDKKSTIASTGLENGSVIQVKDLGRYRKPFALHMQAVSCPADLRKALRSHGELSLSSNTSAHYSYTHSSTSYDRTSTRALRLSHLCCRR